MNNVNAQTLGEDLIGNIDQLFCDALINLLRLNRNSLDAYLHEVVCNVQITNTSTYAHCHVISLDGNKRTRVNDFARFIASRIVDYAIPRSEFKKALDDISTSKSSAAFVQLQIKARNLFKRTSINSGEAGEVLLSILAEAYLGLPQLIAKMSLKTNSQMPVHGCDGIHVSIDKTSKNLVVYWGEAKVYANSSQAINECFSSLAPFLRDAGGSSATQNRDIFLLRDNIDLNNPALETALMNYLDPDNSMFNKMEYRGLCLIGYNSEAYPAEANTKGIEQVKDDLLKSFQKNMNNIEKRVIANKINSFEIQVFCIPFPDVEIFRKAFLNEIGLPNE